MSLPDEAVPSDGIDTRRIAIFTAFTMGLAILGGVVVYATGGVQDSESLIDGVPVTGYAVVTTLLMWVPAIGHVFTRFVTDEGWDGLLLAPDLKRGWQYWLAGWFLPALLTLTGTAIFFAVFPQYLDLSAANIAENLRLPSTSMVTDHVGGRWGFISARLAQMLLFVSLFNAVFAFGEEFGWRAYLQPKLMPLGGRTASVVVGVIWGVWHWPLVMLGHNYGLDYPGAPWLGMLLMVWFGIVASVIFGWLTIRCGSVWPAALGHGANNAFFAIGVYVAVGSPSPLVGPSVGGIVGSLGWTLFAAWLLFRPDASRAFETAATEPQA